MYTHSIHTHTEHTHSLLFYTHPLTLSHAKDRWQCARLWRGLSETRSKPALILQLLKWTWVVLYSSDKSLHSYHSYNHSQTTTCPGPVCVCVFVCVRERVIHISLVILLHCNRERIRASAMVVVTVSCLATPIRLGNWRRLHACTSHYSRITKTMCME